MKNEILSVGIDIGTSTTQVIFSKITLQSTTNSFLSPEVKITEKNIIYRSHIYFTPLIKREKINLEKLKEIILKEYKRAGICKENICTGAIIITGETSRKENAEEVLNALSDFAGDFVVATAGPDLEGILAGYGAGAAEISKKTMDKVINFDIGGGTTNAAVFQEGEVLDSFALDIGGRLIQFDAEGIVIYISDKIKKLINILNLNLAVGAEGKFEEIKILTDKFAEILFKIGSNENLSEEEEELFIYHKNKGIELGLFLFSGGVSEFIYNHCEINDMKDVLKFRDIGPLLGYSIRKKFEELGHKFIEPKEKIRATVIGAGSYSLKISGSTIVFEDDILPMKNIPIIKIFNNEAEDLDCIYKNITNKLSIYENTKKAIAFKGPKAPSYSEIKKMAKGIVEAFKDSSDPIIVIVENDFAKALGQTIKNTVKASKKVICIDNIAVKNGDYIDIGKAIADVIPVVVKTLILKI